MSPAKTRYPAVLSGIDFWHACSQKETSLFEKVGECLYRCQPSGVYYARIESGGKEIRRGLKTTDRHAAKSNLSELRQELAGLDLRSGRITLADLCDRYFKTVQHQKPSTVEGKRLVVDRIKSKWPGGAAINGFCYRMAHSSRKG